MSDLVEYAKRELKLAGLFDEDSLYGGEMGKSVLDLVEVFANQGHSGFSATQALEIFNRIGNYKPLTPLSGEDSEWTELDYNDEVRYQNKRNFAVFKDKDGRVTYGDAIIWREENGSCFNGTVGGIRNLEILGFPFTPKTFYIDVTSERFDKDNDTGVLTPNPDGDWWEHEIKDPTQLDEVWEHYKKPDMDGTE